MLLCIDVQGQYFKQEEIFHVVTLEDGTKLRGVIQDLTSDTMSFAIDNFDQRVVNIARKNVVKTETKFKKSRSSLKAAEYHSTRYLWTESALPTRGGVGYFDIATYFFGRIGYSFTDHLSLDCYVLPDRNFNIDFLPGVRVAHSLSSKVHVAARFNSTIDKTSEGFMSRVMTGMVTYGDRHTNGTIGVMYTRNSADDFLRPISNFYNWGAYFGANVSLTPVTSLKMEHIHLYRFWYFTQVGLSFRQNAFNFNFAILMIDSYKRDIGGGYVPTIGFNIGL